MNLFKRLKKRYPDSFTYLPATHLNPQDRLIARLFLTWLPRGLTPNRVTLFRIVATPFVFFLILQEYYLIGFFAFLIVAFTDALDGTMARTRNQITRFGMLFDPLADKLLVGSVIFILIFRFLNYWLGLAIVGMELIFVTAAIISNFSLKQTKMANVWGKIKMILQVAGVSIILLSIPLGSPFLIEVSAHIFQVSLG